MLGLVWVTGVLALIVEDRGAEQGRRDRASASAAGGATAPAPRAQAAAVPPAASEEAASEEAASGPATPDCLLTAPTGSIQVWAGRLGCFDSDEEHFRFVWNEHQASLLLPERRLSLTVDPRARRQFVAALVEA